MIFDMITGFIMGALIMIFATLLLIASLKHSKYKSQATGLVLISMGISMFSFLIRFYFLRVIGQILLLLALLYGYYGVQRKTKAAAPIFTFFVSFLLCQIIGYKLNIDLLKLIIRSGSYSLYPFTSLLIPIILTLVVSRKCLPKNKAKKVLN